MKRMKVKRIFITALVILVAYVLQCTVFPVLDIAGIKPNLLLIVTASFGFMRGSKSGMLVGFLSGLLIDIQFGKMIGFYALIYLVVGFLNGLFEQMFYDEDIKLPLFLIAVSDFLYGITIYFFTLECASFSVDLQTQARQAPMPHAMRSSMEIQHSMPSFAAYSFKARSIGSGPQA